MHKEKPSANGRRLFRSIWSGWQIRARLNMWTPALWFNHKTKAPAHIKSSELSQTFKSSTFMLFKSVITNLIQWESQVSLSRRQQLNQKLARWTINATYEFAPKEKHQHSWPRTPVSGVGHNEALPPGLSKGGQGGGGAFS